MLNLTQSELLSRELTVTEICRESGINRTTFYAHYNYISDLLARVEKQLWQGIVDEWQSNLAFQQDGSFADFLLRFVLHIEQYQGLYRIFWRQRPRSSVQNDSGPVWESFVRFVRPVFPHTDEHAMRYHLAFSQAGIFAVLRKWVETGCQESADTIYTLLLSLLNKESPEKALPDEI